MLYSLEEMKKCIKCDLHKTRQNVVPGRGEPNASIWLIGEAPGRKEDEIGQAFVGRAGCLLDTCLEKTDIKDFYIANILKCRPPYNRDPTALEMRVCAHAWLHKQITEHEPQIIVAMGRYSIGFFRRYDWDDIQKMRVTKELVEGPFKTLMRRIVIPTFHPAYACRNPEAVNTLIRHFHLAKALQTQLQSHTKGAKNMENTGNDK